MDEQGVVRITRQWVTEFVIGLNLCPFARRTSDAGLVRYAMTEATDPSALLEALARELGILAAAQRATVETTLLIHPRALPDFLDYNDFLGAAVRLVRAVGLRGVIQVAGFHPAYRFAGAAPEAVANYTNRSPYPMLHLLREASVTEAAGGLGKLEDIPRRNAAALNRLGRREVLARLKVVTVGAPRP